MINAGSVYSELILNGDKYFSTLDKADKRMKSFEGNLKKYGQKMEDTGKNLTAKVSAPIAGVAAIATKLGIDFESSMSEVGAISGATGDDLAKLEEKARDMGAATKFSASDAADGLKYMAMAGWETNDMIDGLDGVLALAAASGEDLGLTSDIVTDALTAFGLQAKDAGAFADLLASASSNANTNVAMMGETFKYAAPIAGALGFNAEDTALAIGLMANAGIKASQAGTSLRTIMSRLNEDVRIQSESMGEYDISTQNADGTMRGFREILIDLREGFSDLTEAEKAQNAEAIFGREAMSGMLAVLNASEEDFQKLTKATNDYTGTAKEMSDEMQNNLKGRWEEMKSALSEAALQIYDLLLPALEEWLAKGKAFVDWFNNLDEGTKKAIINIGGLALAIGPLLFAGGKLLKGGSAIVGLLGKISGGATLASGASTTLASGLGATGAAAKASALLFNPWTAGAAAAAGAGYLIYQELNERVIPEIKIFDETISETTKNVVGNFLDMEKDVTISLNQLKWSGQEVTEEMATDIVGNFEEMKNDVVLELEEQKEEALRSLEELFANSTDMTEEEKEEMIRITNEKYDEQIQKTEESHGRITEIFEDAKENNRSITEEEWKEITKIKEDLKEDSIRLLSETQEESETILKNLKENADTLTTEMAADVIKNSLKQKEETIKKAEEEYQERLRYAETLKKDGSKESEELANKIIEEAERQRDDSISAAEEMHEDVLKEIENQGEDILKQIDLDNGKIKSKWQELQEWFNRNPIVRKIKEIREENSAGTAWSGMRTGNNAHGTNYWTGGLTWVGEQGPELIELPQATKVYSNQKSKDIVSGVSKGITQNIHIYSPTPLSPSEISRKNLQVSRQLAMEWEL